MKKINGRIQIIKANVQTNVKRFAVEGITFSSFLILVAVLLSVNILRVITNGTSNYQTYLQEKQALDEIEQKNEALQQEYAYVSSDEFKKLILKDSYAIAEGNENLYRTKERPEYFDEEIELLALKEKKDFTDWWLMLIKN